MKKLLNTKLKDMKGITLLALVITIIILLIISTVAITLLVNNNLMGNAKYAVDKYNNSANEEYIELAKMHNEIDGVSSNRAETQVSGVPVGTILSLISSNAPEGYLACDGQKYSVSEYENLYNALKDLDHTGWAAADWTTEFTVPDLRGEFLRGAGTNTHSNQGNGGNVGEHTNEGLPNITGNSGAQSHVFGAGAANGAFTGSSTWQDKNQGHSSWTSNYIVPYFNASKSNAIYGSSEHVTPTNTSVTYYIKY